MTYSTLQVDKKDILYIATEAARDEIASRGLNPNNLPESELVGLVKSGVLAGFQKGNLALVQTPGESQREGLDRQVLIFEAYKHMGNGFHRVTDTCVEKGGD